jgi:hypothetical protein
MRLKRDLAVFALSIALNSLVMPAVFVRSVSAQTQDSRIAMQRGFRTGYSDGYMAGYRDTIDSLARDYSRHPDYQKADRAFNRDYGLIEDYRNGYQQGFESGYDTGFARRSFDSTLPTDLKKRPGVIISDSQNLATTNQTDTSQTAVSTASAVRFEQTSATTGSSSTDVANKPAQENAVIIIPRETELTLELQGDLSTEHSRTGDKFTAKVVSPSELSGATIEGRVNKITHPGRLKRRSELLLSFDRIMLPDNRWSNMSATLIEVVPVKGDNVRLVDSEGTAIGQSSIKQDAIKVGGSTGAGLIVGGIVGGPVGAAVGAGMGAAFGVGAVVIERGKHIRLNQNQQLRVKTAYETQIR